MGQVINLPQCGLAYPNGCFPAPMRLAVPGRMRGARRRTCSRSDTGTVGSFSAAEPPFSQHCRPACGPLSPCAALWCAVVTAVQPGSRAPEPGNPALRAVRTTVPALRGSVLTALPHFARVITLAKCGIPSRARYRLQNYLSASPPPGRTGTRLQLLRKGLEAAQPVARSNGVRLRLGPPGSPMVTDRHERDAAPQPTGFGPVADTRARRKSHATRSALALLGPMPTGFGPVADTHHAVGARHSRCAGRLRAADPLPELRQRCAAPTVREMGLEPTRLGHWNLNPARLPIPPLARPPSVSDQPTLLTRRPPPSVSDQPTLPTRRAPPTTRADPPELTTGRTNRARQHPNARPYPHASRGTEHA